MQGKIVTFGEVMLRLSTPGFSRIIQAQKFNASYAGGEANVSLCLANLGVPSEHVTRFPNNDLGLAATRFLNQNNLYTDNIIYGGDRMGVYFLETGASLRATRVVYDRAHSAFSSLNPQEFEWSKILKGAQWFHWTGITPGISQAAADACLEAITTANKLGVTVSADVNSRKNLWRYGKMDKEVMPKLVQGCDIVVASKNDLIEIFDLKPSVEKGEKYISLCQQFMDRFPRVKKIATTKRESISATHNNLSSLLWNGTNLIKSSRYEINPIVDRVGGGDAFMGGLIYGLINFNEDSRALEFAVATAALKHTIEGDASLVSVAEVEALMLGETSGKLIR